MLCRLSRLLNIRYSARGNMIAKYHNFSGTRIEIGECNEKIFKIVQKCGRGRFLVGLYR